jgi:hypothetical protein
MNRLALIFMVAVGLMANAGAASAEKRVALVIGNSSYTNTPPLRTPANDAADIASALDRLGFDVVRGFDLDYIGMREKVKLFSERLEHFPKRMNRGGFPCGHESDSRIVLEGRPV